MAPSPPRLSISMLYELSSLCGINAIFARIVGCHCTTCSYRRSQGLNRDHAYLYAWLGLWEERKKSVLERDLLLSENYNFDTADQTRCRGRILPNQFAEEWSSPDTSLHHLAWERDLPCHLSSEKRSWSHYLGERPRCPWASTAQAVSVPCTGCEDWLPVS